MTDEDDVTKIVKVTASLDGAVECVDVNGEGICPEGFIFALVGSGTTGGKALFSQNGKLFPSGAESMLPPPM